MTTDGDPSLSLREVEERFTASAAALETVKETLDSLASFADIQREASGRLEGIAQRLDEHVRATNDAVHAVGSAQQAARDSFAALARLVDNADTRVLHDAINRLDGNLTSAVQELKAAVDDSADARRERDEALSQLHELQGRFDRLRAAAGTRTLRKAGVDDQGAGGSPLSPM